MASYASASVASDREDTQVEDGVHRLVNDHTLVVDVSSGSLGPNGPVMTISKQGDAEVPRSILKFGDTDDNVQDAVQTTQRDQGTRPQQG